MLFGFILLILGIWLAMHDFGTKIGVPMIVVGVVLILRPAFGQ